MLRSTCLLACVKGAAAKCPVIRVELSGWEVIATGDEIPLLVLRSNNPALLCWGADAGMIAVALVGKVWTRSFSPLLHRAAVGRTGSLCGVYYSQL